MDPIKAFELSVYYDGLCVLCSKEINHYKKQKGSEKIRFVDITSSDFKANEEGVDPFEVHKIMHAKKSNGQIVTKVDAFVAIWEVLPKYHWAARWVMFSPIRKLMDAGYIVFAKARPYLPRRKKEDCADSPFCDLK